MRNEFSSWNEKYLRWDKKSPRYSQYLASSQFGYYCIRKSSEETYSASYTSTDGHEIYFEREFFSVYEAKEFCESHYIGRLKK